MAAPTPVQSTIVDSYENIVRKITIPTGGDADITATNICDISTFTNGRTSTEFKLKKVQYCLDGCSVQLYWKADANVHIVTLGPGQGEFEFTSYNPGGLPNNAGSGKDGDMYFTTSGVSATDNGHFVFIGQKV